MNGFTKQIIINFLNNKKNLMVFLGILSLQLYNTMKVNQEYYSYDYLIIHHSLFNSSLLLILILPIYMYFVMELFGEFNYLLVFVRFKNGKPWRVQKSIVLLGLSFLFTLLLHSGMFLYLILNNFNSLFKLEETSLIILGFVLCTIGFYLIGEIILFLEIILKNKIILISSLYIGFLVPEFIKGIFYLPVYNYFDFIFYLNISDYKNIVMFLIFNLILIIMFIVSIRFIIYFFDKKRDLMR